MSEELKQRKAIMRKLRARAFTLVSKLDEFSDLSAQVYPHELGIPGVENLKQEMMAFYSSGYDQ